MKRIILALALLAATPLAAIENGDPFSTGDSYGPRGGDFSLRETAVPVPAHKASKVDCSKQFLSAAEWMKCNPEFQSPAPGTRHGY